MVVGTIQQWVKAFWQAGGNSKRGCNGLLRAPGDSPLLAMLFPPRPDFVSKVTIIITLDFANIVIKSMYFNINYVFFRCIRLT